MPKSFRDRLAALEALEAAAWPLLIDSEPERCIPDDLTLAHIWGGFLYGVEINQIYWRYGGKGNNQTVLAASPRHFADYIEACYRAAWPELAITYEDVCIIAAVAFRDWRAGRLLIPLAVEQVDTLLDWHATGRLTRDLRVLSHYHGTPDDQVQRMFATALHWRERRGLTRFTTVDEAAAWLRSIRPELVELQGYDPALVHNEST